MDSITGLGGIVATSISGKTAAAGVTSGATGFATLLAAATTESWGAVAVGAAVGTISAVYFVVGALNDRRVNVLTRQLDWLQSANAALEKDVDEGRRERRRLAEQCEVLSAELVQVRSTLKMLKTQGNGDTSTGITASKA